MANGRIESGGSLNLIVEWSSNQNSVTANLFLYNQYRINASTSKSCAINLSGNTYNFSHVFGNVSAGTTTFLGSHTIYNLNSGTNYYIGGYCDIEITYNGSYVGRILAEGNGYTDQQQNANFVNYGIETIGLDFVRVRWSTDMAIDSLQYSLNDGVWENTNYSGSWGNSFDVSNLNPNQHYSIRLRVNKNGTTTGGYLNFTTKDIGKITQLNDFNFGDTLRIVKSNASSEQNNIEIQILDQTIRNITNTQDDMTIVFSQEELDKIYRIMNLKDQIKVKVTVKTSVRNRTWSDSREINCIQIGKAKTINIVVDNVYRRAEIGIVKDGILKRGIIATVVDGKMKGCM